MTFNQRLIVKIFSIILLGWLCISFNTYAQSDYSATTSAKNDDFELQPGDIILTKGPVLFGFFGHSSIALDHDTVLQIEGPGQKTINQSFD